MGDPEETTPIENEEASEEPETETDDSDSEEPQEAEPAEESEPAAEPKEEVKPRQPSNEIKVVIVMKDDKIMLGVQSPDCDPEYDTMTGTLDDALGAVPPLIVKAKEKWATNPRNPKAFLPTTPPPPPSTRSTTTGSTQKKAEKPSFF